MNSTLRNILFGISIIVSCIYILVIFYDIDRTFRLLAYKKSNKSFESLIRHQNPKGIHVHIIMDATPGAERLRSRRKRLRDATTKNINPSPGVASLLDQTQPPSVIHLITPEDTKITNLDTNKYVNVYNSDDFESKSKQIFKQDPEGDRWYILLPANYIYPKTFIEEVINGDLPSGTKFPGIRVLNTSGDHIENGEFITRSALCSLPGDKAVHSGATTQLRGPGGERHPGNTRHNFSLKPISYEL